MRDCDLFCFLLHYVRLQLWELRNKNEHFVLFIYIIFVRKIFSCSKSMMLNKFVIDFFPVTQTIFEIKMLTLNFAARWCCKWFHCVAHGHFTRPRHHFYDYSSFHLEIIGVATDFSGHIVQVLSNLHKKQHFYFLLSIQGKESIVLGLIFRN